MMSRPIRTGPPKLSIGDDLKQSDFNRERAAGRSLPEDWIIIPTVNRVHLITPRREGVYYKRLDRTHASFVRDLEALIEDGKPRSILVYSASNASPQNINDFLPDLTALASVKNISLASVVVPRGTAVEWVQLLCRDAGHRQ